MASLIRLTKLPESDKNRILFVNPDSHEPRDPNNPDGNLILGAPHILRTKGNLFPDGIGKNLMVRILKD